MSTKTDFKAQAMARFESGPMQSRAVRAEEHALMSFEGQLADVESPIEAMFLNALFEECAFDSAVFWERRAHKYFGSVTG
jgi:hypothetical protein